MIPHPIVSKLVIPLVAALIGAGTGGYITQDIVTGDTRTQLLSSTYGSYLSEATRSLSLSELDKLTEDDRERLHRVTAALILSASEDVLCRAYEFANELGGDSQLTAYSNLVVAMREEIGIADMSNLETPAECSLSLFNF